MDRSIGLMVLVGVFFFAGGFLFRGGPSPDASQPIPFNHKVHAANDIACSECHFRCEQNRDEDGDLACAACEESAFIFCENHVACPDHKLPGLPGAEVCASCHEGDDPEGPGKTALLAYLESGRPIPWERVTRIETSNVHFSHRTHAIVEEILCVECHGDVGSMESPPSRPAVDVRMDWCLRCHHEQGASEGCVACHR